MPRFDTGQALLASNATSDLRRLSQLDDVWTSYLAAPGPVPPRDAQDLSAIAGEMRDVLGRIGTHTIFLRRIIQQRRVDFDNAYRVTLAAAPLSGNQAGPIDQIVKVHGGFATFALDQLALLEQQSAAESSELQAKVSRINKNGITQGDLSHRFKCALGIAILASTLAMLVVTGTILAPAVVAAVNGGSAAIIAAFATHEGIGLLKEAATAAYEVWHLIEAGCFKRR